MAEQRKRDKHLQQVDQTKKLFIDQILRRNCLDDEADVFDEIVEATLKGDTTAYTQTELEQRKKQEIQKIKNKQTEAYFRKLTQNVKVDPQGKIELREFPLRIVFLDQILTHFPSKISELCLNSTFMTAPECLVLAGN